MEYKISAQFESTKNMAENTEFFTDPFYMELTKSFINIEQLLAILEENANLIAPYLQLSNGAIVLKGSVAWTQEKIDEYNKSISKINQKPVEASNLDVEKLKELLKKYPKEALKILSEQ